jgi:CRISPR/Cas system-associated exonuclease Cas4 (RecB family)
MELAVHNPNISIHKQQLQLKGELHDVTQPITVEKTPEMIEQIKNIGQKGFSASALTTFINCKLRYYMRYLLKLKTDETIEQSMENNTFGTILHGALENLYKPFEGQKIEPDELEKRTRLIDDILATEYKVHFSGSPALRGKNLLLMEVMKKMIKKTILNDAIGLKHEPRLLLRVENKLTSEVITKHGQMILEGTIDRIDKGEKDSLIRVVDYKSGSVEIKDLTIGDISSITSQPEKSKAFQLMHYALLYHNNYPNERITAGNISLRRLSNGFMEPKFTDGSTVQDNLDAFRETVVALIEEILNEKDPFAQTENLELCTYCDYKNICNRIQTS